MTFRCAKYLLTLLAILGAPPGMAATVTITASTLTPTVGDTFTLTITGDSANTFAATMGLSFNASTVAYVGGTALLPWNVYVKNSVDSANPTVIDVEAPSPMPADPGVYDVAVLTFEAIAAGAANIVIDDDGGNVSGWFDADTADYIPNTYTQANVAISVNGPVIIVTDSTVPTDDLLVPFGQVTEGTTSAARTVTVTNSGTQDLVLGAVGMANPLDLPYALASDTCTNANLPPASSCTVTVDFSPTSTGDFPDSFDIPSNDATEPTVTVTVSGTGTPMPVGNAVVTDSVAPFTDNTVTFGSVTQNLTATQTVTVTNDGNASLTLGQVATLNPLVAPFSVINDTCSGQALAPLDDCSFEVLFQPTAVGAVSDALDIPTDDPDLPSVTVSVTGAGASVPVPDIAVTDSSGPAADLQITFGDVDVGASVNQMVTVTNQGTEDLVIGAAAGFNPLPAPFAIATDSCSGQTIPPAGSCTIVVAFEPAATQANNDSFDIPSNDPDEPSVIVSVGGTGVPAPAGGGGSSALDPATLLALVLLGLAGRRRATAGLASATSG